MDKIICSNIWKIFGNDEKRILDNLDPNLSRDEVQEKTGHVVAVKDVSFSIQKGETFVVTVSYTHLTLPTILRV